MKKKKIVSEKRLLSACNAANRLVHTFPSLEEKISAWKVYLLPVTRFSFSDRVRRATPPPLPPPITGENGTATAVSPPAGFSYAPRKEKCPPNPRWRRVRGYRPSYRFIPRLVRLSRQQRSRVPDMFHTVDDSDARLNVVITALIGYHISSWTHLIRAQMGVKTYIYSVRC